MRLSRRSFVKSSALAVAATMTNPRTSLAQSGAGEDVPASIRALAPFPGRGVPISDDERRGRIEKARRLMTEHGMSAIVLEPGTSMSYYADVR